MTKPNTTPPLDPRSVGVPSGHENQVPACPTGLNQPLDSATDAAAAHGPLGVEKLEGRQEAGRDAQDEAEENLPG
jgi:hypothetical protein